MSRRSDPAFKLSCTVTPVHVIDSRSGALHLHDTSVLQGCPRLHHHVRPDTEEHLPERCALEEGPGQQVSAGWWISSSLSLASQQGQCRSVLERLLLSLVLMTTGPKTEDSENIARKL